MRDVIEVSYTGDLLAHRRCARSWAYQKHAGFRPYEQVQAMEGRLIHHAMEWMTAFYKQRGRHSVESECQEQMERYFRVLWARGIRTRFESKADTLGRILGNLFPSHRIHPTVKAAIEGAQHAEYEIRAIRQLVPARTGGKSKLLLTGILDLVVQQQQPLTYHSTWKWTDASQLQGEVNSKPTIAATGDEEIWDYKGTRASTTYLTDYVRQLLTYAAIYRERTGRLPVRCVLFFINEPERERQLVSIPVDVEVVNAALDWTHRQVEYLQQTVLAFEQAPLNIEGGEFENRMRPAGERMSDELKQQCTACGLRFDCKEYRTYIGPGKNGGEHPDVDRLNVKKN